MISPFVSTGVSGRGVLVRGIEHLTGTDKDVFCWLTFNNCSVTSFRTLYDTSSGNSSGNNIHNSDCLGLGLAKEGWRFEEDFLCYLLFDLL